MWAGACLSPVMDEVLQRLTEISIRQQQIVEHLATRQGAAEQEIASIRAAATAGPPCSRRPAVAEVDSA
ncbi:hypothetical protein QQF64_019265 [Cirrhinus molitorella]|uniref:Uncharacterized protein n=1 Tax=Cirrhinus molitorella TaxID=172907 RepID=A0ABR3LIC5_9TELE